MALFGSSEDKTKEAVPVPSSPASAVTDGKQPTVVPPASMAKPIASTLKDLAASSPAPRGEVLASIGRGSRVTGKLQFDGTVRIEGTVEGELAAQDMLQIGERAVVNAQITGTIVVIRGTVTGDVRARKRVEIRAPGKLRGNVTTPSLVIDDGVVFEGYCSMGAERAERPDRPEEVGSSRVDLQACKLEYSIVSPK